MARPLRLTLGSCLVAASFTAVSFTAVSFTAAPASASCAGAVAEVPRLVTLSDGSIVVRGFGGGSFCDDGAQASVCLDRNVGTVVSTCRTYDGRFPQGATGDTPCAVGVWKTYVVVVPGYGAPVTTHSTPLLVATCTSAST